MSSGLVDFLQENGCLKEALHDGVIDIYTGAQPASGDAAATGTKLARITLASGAFTAGVKSTQEVNTITINAPATDGFTYIISVNGTSYTYTASSDTTTTVAAGLAALLDASPVVSATNVANVVTVRALYGGVEPTIVEGASTGDLTLAETVANVRINGLQWGDSVLGVLSKEAGVWSGVALATGSAGYFRFKANAVDDDTLSTTLVRMDGNISTSNAPLIVSSVNFVAGTTITVDSAAITRPTS
jgi:hypothetical protein